MITPNPVHRSRYHVLFDSINDFNILFSSDCDIMISIAEQYYVLGKAVRLQEDKFDAVTDLQEILVIIIV